MFLKHVAAAVLLSAFASARPELSSSVSPSNLKGIQAEPMTIFNSAANSTLFMFPNPDASGPAGVPIKTDGPEQGDYSRWDRYYLSKDHYWFKNIGTGYWLMVDQNDTLVAVPDETPTTFVARSVGGQKYVISPRDKDTAWQPTYGASMIYGYVLISFARPSSDPATHVTLTQLGLRPRDEKADQHWTFRHSSGAAAAPESLD
ncbi:unnamed protein product [Mycena citricolor]|uniref:Uncharacterized protein n=1 Tax=Mycena citricolor TaxID=2018698 RepID=A0AAD2K3G6_9AGAR|nr:unnamed protein product [Mycena citricolor]